MRAIPIETFVDHVARSVSGFARRRPRRLVALTVEAPRSVPPESLRALLIARLKDLGLEDIALTIVEGDGVGRVSSLEFERAS